MKTSLAILVTVLLAAATLTFGAPVTQMSGAAVARGSGPDKWCGAAVCPPKQAPSARPVTDHRGHSY
jgi:hypothetical protein